MKKISTLLAVLLAAFSFGQLNAQTTTWDFTTTNPSWSSGGMGISPVQIIDSKGLGLYNGTTNANFGAWSTSSSASWSAPNDVYSGTVRVSTNGGGFAAGGNESLPTQRYFFIQVNQACTVKVWFKSASGGAQRSLIASDGVANYGKVTTNSGATGVPTDGAYLSASVTKAGTFYLYGDQGLTIYQIQVVGATVSLTPTNPLNTTAPVKFGAINLSQSNGFVKVAWDILTEINTEKYVIERSSNGSSFSAIGNVAAANANRYAFVDNAPLSNVAGYYRIKAVDKDGTIGYSNVVKIGSKQTQPDIAIAPNPVKGGQLNIQMNNLVKGNYTAVLYDAAGKQIFNKQLAVEAGSSVQSVQLTNVKAGIYQLQVTNGDIKMNKTVVVQ